MALEDSTNYYFEMREVNTKFDVNTGEKQCNGYGMGYARSDEVYTYGLNVTNALSIILDIPRKDIILKNKEFEKQYFEFNYKSKNGLGKIDKNVAINKILDKYNLKLQSDSITVKAFNLKVLDSFKLKNHLSKNKIGEYSYKYKNFETELKGVTLKHFADYLNKQSPLYHFFSETEIDNSYDFKIIPNSNIDHLNKTLEEKYGLIFEKDSLKIKKITIKTAANTV